MRSSSRDTGQSARYLLVVILLLVFASAASAGDIYVTAAVSLKEALNDLSREYARKHQVGRIVSNYGGSGTLAKQIENGAPADIFISASPEWTDYLEKGNILERGSVRALAYNSLVFAGPATSAVRSMADLPKLKKIALGSPKSVPAGEYAAQAIKNAGIEKALEKHLVYSKDAREALVYAERADVEGAFVYRTDALRASKARILFAVPGSLHSRIVYPMGLTATGAGKREARGFFAFLQSSEAKTVLQKYGFGVQ